VRVAGHLGGILGSGGASPTAAADRCGAAVRRDSRPAGLVGGRSDRRERSSRHAAGPVRPGAAAWSAGGVESGAHAGGAVSAACLANRLRHAVADAAGRVSVSTSAGGAGQTSAGIVARFFGSAPGPPAGCGGGCGTPPPVSESVVEPGWPRPPDGRADHLLLGLHGTVDPLAGTTGAARHDDGPGAAV